MKHQIQGFTAWAKFIDTVDGFPNDPMERGKGSNHNHFIVTLAKDKVRRSFSYYDSVHNYEQGKQELNEADLKQAMYSFFSDALSGNQSFDDFAGEFGYDADSRTAEKIWRACKRSLAKVQGFGLSEQEIIDLINTLDS